jgi:hypothetical protein
MKYASSLMLLLLLFALGVSVPAQEAQSAAERVENLKAELLDVQGREDGSRMHLQQLDEAIKPENIERSLAGVGSTRPEELRESRRKQLSIERNGVLAQLQTLQTSRTRLESEIANAEALAYQESAKPPGTMMLVAGSLSRKVMFAGGGLALVVLGGAGTLLYRRKRLR